ncbi:barstar family protein [Streptomyces mashuensis]|nr:barstar family protein [Streptomyces mashuensis]
MDGEKMLTSDGVFEEFWEGFRFPDYFGWNWNALLDCLRDLHWRPADRYLTVISNSGRLLSGAPDEREIFFKTLHRVAMEWANPHGKPGGKGVPFNLLLFCDSEEVEGLRGDVERCITV